MMIRDVAYFFGPPCMLKASLDETRRGRSQLSTVYIGPLSTLIRNRQRI